MLLTILIMLVTFAPLLYVLSYFLGQFANFLNHATSMIASKSRPEIDSVGAYFHAYGPRLFVRFLWNTIIVVVVALVPQLFFPSYSLDVHIDKLSPGAAVLLKCMVWLAFGLGSDLILKKAQDVAKSKGIDTDDAIPGAPRGQTQVINLPDKSDSTGAGK